MKTEVGWLRFFWSAVLMAIALSCSPSGGEQLAESVTQALLPSGWQGIDIGTTGAKGTDGYSGNTFSITGAGTGIGASDSLHFTYTQLTGDFTLVAEIVGCSGTPGTSVGLMVRQDLSPTSVEASIFFRPNFPGGTAPNTSNITFHVPATPVFYQNPSAFTSMQVPLYLKLVRSGADLAMYKSSDGIAWSLVGPNQSGGQFSATGITYVGFAVSSGSASPASATIDNWTLKQSGSLAYESSWVGNSLTKDSTGYVSGTAAAMAVTADGTVITKGPNGAEEGGQFGKIYKNGSVVATFGDPPQGPQSGSWEGSVASDGSYIYLFGTFGPSAGVFRTNMTGGASSATMINFAHPITTSSPGGVCQVSGMALGNGELYVSNASTGTVLVANPLQQMYFTSNANNTCNTISSASIDVSGVANPAPLNVYQSSRESDGFSYALPGFTPGASYSVRLHFAALNPNTQPGSYVGQITVGTPSAPAQQIVPSFDPYVQAGNAINKATTQTLGPVHPDSSGIISVSLAKTTSIRIFVNGIEVLDATGAPVFQLNAGGGQSGNWKSDVHELVDRAITNLTRPGPIAVDKRGNLWIVQEGTTFPATGKFISAPDAPGGAAISLYDKYGNDLHTHITDLVNPTAIAYDSNNDRLLVAEAGPAGNIRIYTGLDSTTPSCTDQLGQSVFSPPAGLSYAPGAGGYARFYSPTGVGIDNNDNIYVLNNVNSDGTDLRAFSPSKDLLWSLASLDYLGVGDFAPSSKYSVSSDIFTTTKHYKLNLGNLGNEWSLYSYLYNPFLYGPQSRPNNSSAIVRRLGVQQETVVFVSGQGTVGAVEMYRLSTAYGEQLIPAGSYDGTTLWIDDGDGIMQSSERSTGTPFGFQAFDVDSNGNIHLIEGNPTGPNHVRELKLVGINSTSQVPIYSLAGGNLIDRAIPPPFNAGATLTRVKYDALGDSLYVMGATNASTLNDGWHEYTSVLARYDGWVSGPLETVFAKTLPTPATDTNFMYNTKPYSLGLNFQFEAMDVVQPYVFAAEVWGPIHVFNSSSGNQVTIISAGPEVDGENGWEDAAMGLRAGYNDVYGEYDILTENSGRHAKQNFFRWNGVTDPASCNALGNAATTETFVSTPGGAPTGTGGVIPNGYYRAVSGAAYHFSDVTGTTFMDSLLISNNNVQTNIIDWSGFGSQNFTIQTNGSSITGTETCSNAYDSVGWPFSTYTATAETLTLYSELFDYSVVYYRFSAN